MNAPTDADRTLSTARVFQATPQEIDHAFAHADLFARWWGPAGFRSTFHVFEFRPGGRWVHTLHGPDGTDYANECRFVDIVPGERVVIEHLSAPWFTLTLAQQDGGTRLGWRQSFADAETCARLAPICVPSNEQNLDRLQAVLASAA